ncbi:MAG: putative metallopeptidase [Acidobacteriota bacterium]
MRPRPPHELLDPLCLDPLFIASPELDRWARETFINPKAKLRNKDHEHLQQAEIGWLWTNVSYSRQMMSVVGYAEIPRPPQGVGKWLKARFEYQLWAWFQRKLDFLITLYAPYADEADSITFCAVIEHELYHCGQARDEYDCPKFKKSGGPVFAIKGHDFEEHIGVVRRYGINASAGRGKELFAAAKKRPLIGRARVNGVCGTCAVKL